jgi:alkylation response protein AidB-like acyl-CoA dehydrogenase
MATTASTDITNEWLVRAASLATVVEEHRDAAETNRELPQPVFEAMRDAGLYSMLLPRAFGGHEIDLVTSLRVYEEIARFDGSVAWNIMIGSQGGFFSEYLPREAAQLIYGGASTVGAGAFSPTGQAVIVDGGYRLSGRWAFASGCAHASWLVCGAIVMSDGKPVLREDGAPQVRILFIPASEGTILDTWHTGGLRGTGSHDFEVHDVFVPAERSFPFPHLITGSDTRETAAYPQPFLLLAGIGMAAVALGIARDALDSFRQLALEKTPTGARSKLSTQPVVHDRYAEAEALVASARSYLYEVTEELAASRQPPDGLAAKVRLAGAHAARVAERAVETVYSLGGGSSIYSISRLDRCFRDVHVVSHHVAVSPSQFELVGQYLLGGPLLARR